MNNQTKPYLWYAFGYEDAIESKPFDETKQFRDESKLDPTEKEFKRFYKMGFDQGLTDAMTRHFASLAPSN
jgi:hypothetical protein